MLNKAVRILVLVIAILASCGAPCSAAKRVALTFRLRQDGDGALFRCVSQFAEVLPAAVQRRLDSRKGSLHDVADLLERISQNILQYDSAALSLWKLHEGP